MIIAIDGPAGAGKSTVARLAAKRLGFLYIDTGAMYRAVTLKALEAKIDTSDIAEIIRLAKNINIEMSNSSEGELKLVVDSQDVTLKIREPIITKHVSDIAKIKGVRDEMVLIQRKLGNSSDSVLDGRDIATVVFPDADRKFYIDASPKVRAKRRFKELQDAGTCVTAEEIEQDITNRDRIDSTREVAPLKKARDAIYIDTTDMSIEEVVDRILAHVR